uniref:Uncharacterized protein n=1 Tax=Glossina austeni TaxID=7395 RepID=A0A1A9VUI1_GLOAU
MPTAADVRCQLATCQFRFTLLLSLLLFINTICLEMSFVTVHILCVMRQFSMKIIRDLMLSQYDAALEKKKNSFGNRPNDTPIVPKNLPDFFEVMEPFFSFIQNLQQHVLENPIKSCTEFRELRFYLFLFLSRVRVAHYLVCKSGSDLQKGQEERVLGRLFTTKRHAYLNYYEVCKRFSKKIESNDASINELTRWQRIAEIVKLYNDLFMISLLRQSNLRLNERNPWSSLIDSIFVYIIIVVKEKLCPGDFAFSCCSGFSLRGYSYNQVLAQDSRDLRSGAMVSLIFLQKACLKLLHFRSIGSTYRQGGALSYAIALEEVVCQSPPRHGAIIRSSNSVYNTQRYVRDDR